MSDEAVSSAPLEVLSSPHAKGGLDTRTIMFNVTCALIPVVVMAAAMFGLSALLLVAATTLACVATEALFCLLARKPQTAGDWSAVITGILLALTLPPGFPLWMGAVGGFVSIGLGKMLFGGLGYNVFNPALVGRAFLQAAFPVAITTWTPAGAANRFSQCIPTTLAWPFMTPDMDAFKAYIAQASAEGFSGATALSVVKFGEGTSQAPDVASLFMGSVAGCAGETSAAVILICGAYLAFRKMLDWRIPAAMLGSAALFSALFYYLDDSVTQTPQFMLCSGGLMLGAVFMATDMVTSPVTPAGVWIYGVFLGFMTVLIRLKGGLPEGVMYAILLGNSIIPLLNLVTQPRVYGTKGLLTRK